MKKTVSFFLLATMLFLTAIPSFAFADSNAFTNAKKGDTVTFGRYEQDENYSNGAEPLEWIVVETSSDSIRLVSRYAIECMQFDPNDWPTNWKTSEVRKWLNETFYEEAFTADEQNLINLTLLHNSGNTPYAVSDQGDTYDRIFLLDRKEVETYFGTKTGEKRFCQPTKHAVANGAYVNDYANTTWWWTRSPGRSLKYAIYVGSKGNMDVDGNSIIWENGCVRPALVVSTTTSSSSTSGLTTSGTLFCSQCGKQILADSKFCSYCGHKVG